MEEFLVLLLLIIAFFLGGLVFTRLRRRQTMPHEVLSEKETQDGAVDKIVTGAKHFGEETAAEVMIPRVDIVYLTIAANFKEVMECVVENNYSRIPVTDESREKVKGILYVKDLLRYRNEKDDFQWRQLLRAPYFIPESKMIDDLLMEFQKNRVHIAIVVDEYGCISGMVTMEDILEEIVGEIHDEYDENEDELIKEISDHEYIIEGSMSLDDVNDHLHTELNSEDYDSLGGLIIEHLDRLPQMGDEVVTEDGIRLVVEKLDKNRVETVHVYLPERADTEEEADEENSDPSETDKHLHE